MIRVFKKLLYFPIAYYFRFWAWIQLYLWKPRIVVITGSSGKTTLLHLIEAQLGDKAKYSHKANSSYGIPFDILGLVRKDLTANEWVYLFFLAPFKTFKAVPKEKIYVVEADCDRPGEGKFLASLLKPEITLWISSGLTHSVNFDSLVKNKCFSLVEKAIAYEFGHFLEYTQKLVITNGDSSYIQNQLERAQTPIKKVTKKDLNGYRIHNNRTEFIIEHIKYSINFIVPKDVFYSIEMTNLLMKYLNTQLNPNFPNFNLPPGRNSVFKGIKNTILIDSTYNATPDGVRSILELFELYPRKNKWIVLGDMIELGDEEKEEHEKIADLISPMKLAKVILIGPRLSKYTYPKLIQNVILSERSESKDPLQNSKEDEIFRYTQNDNIKVFIMPKEGMDYISNNIKGGETILFKGARFLERIIEHLLLNKNDIKKLVRREKAWQNRRKAWGL